MKAIRIHQVGGPQVLRLEDIPVPQPGPGEARIKVQAAGVNFTDIYSRLGLYPLKLPAVLGSESAGIVDAIGEGVTGVKPGDRVVTAAFPGSYSEFAVGPAWKLAPIPQGVQARDAAAVLLQGLTAHYLSHSTYPLKPGDVALVHAAAGGLGLLLVQMAKQLGARVIGTVSTPAKAQLAKEAGADEVILYTQVDWESETRRLTDGKGVDVVYDSVGLTTFDKSLNVLRPRGMMVLLGQSSGVVPPMDPQVLNAKGSLYLTRPTLGHYIATPAELRMRANDLFAWMLAGQLRVRIDKTFALADAAQAHEYLAGRQSKGKLLLIP